MERGLNANGHMNCANRVVFTRHYDTASTLTSLVRYGRKFVYVLQKKTSMAFDVKQYQQQQQQQPRRLSTINEEPETYTQTVPSRDQTDCLRHLRLIEQSNEKQQPRKYNSKRVVVCTEDKQCKFIAKITNFATKQGQINSEGLTRALTERIANRELNSNDSFSAKMHNYWICKSKVYSIFTRYDTNLLDFVQQQNNTLQFSVLKDIVNKLRHVNSNGWIHANSNLRNFLINTNTRKLPTKLVVSNFTRSGDFKNLVPFMLLVDYGKLDKLTDYEKFLIKVYDIIHLHWSLIRDNISIIDSTGITVNVIDALLTFISQQDLLDFNKIAIENILRDLIKDKILLSETNKSDPNYLDIKSLSDTDRKYLADFVEGSIVQVFRKDSEKPEIGTINESGLNKMSRLIIVDFLRHQGLFKWHSGTEWYNVNAQTGKVDKLTAIDIFID